MIWAKALHFGFLWAWLGAHWHWLGFFVACFIAWASLYVMLFIGTDQTSPTHPPQPNLREVVGGVPPPKKILPEKPRYWRKDITAGLTFADHFPSPHAGRTGGAGRTGWSG